METTLMTELKAVNMMLEVIGEQPISNLEISGVADVAIARRTLEEESRAVQEMGWFFNTDDAVTFYPDTEGNINLGSNILRAVITYPDDSEYIIRGARLYNKSNRTFVFSECATVNITTFLPWDELPSTARTYIAVRSCRKFQQKVFGDEAVEKYTELDESIALSSLKDFEADSGNYNILKNSEALMR
jgi:hypothetical protein